MLIIIFGLSGCTSPWCVKAFGYPSWGPDQTNRYVSAVNPCLSHAFHEWQHGTADGMVWYPVGLNATHADPYWIKDGKVHTKASMNEGQLDRAAWIPKLPVGIKY